MFAQLFALAILIESVVETIKWIYTDPDNITIINRAVSLGVSILICLVVPEADVFKAVDIQIMVPFVGQILTGFIVARGSNFLHDLIQTVSGVSDITQIKG